MYIAYEILDILDMSPMYIIGYILDMSPMYIAIYWI